MIQSIAWTTAWFLCLSFAWFPCHKCVFVLRIASELNEFCGPCTKQRLPNDMNGRKYTFTHDSDTDHFARALFYEHVSFSFSSLSIFYSQFTSILLVQSVNIRMLMYLSWMVFFYCSRFEIISSWCIDGIVSICNRGFYGIWHQWHFINSNGICELYNCLGEFTHRKCSYIHFQLYLFQWSSWTLWTAAFILFNFQRLIFGTFITVDESNLII